MVALLYYMVKLRGILFLYYYAINCLFAIFTDNNYPYDNDANNNLINTIYYES